MWVGELLSIGQPPSTCLRWNIIVYILIIICRQFAVIGRLQDWISSSKHTLLIGILLSVFRSGGEYLQAYAAVKRMINVNTRCSINSLCFTVCNICSFSHRDGCTDSSCCDSNFAVNDNNKLLWRGAEKLGYQPERIPRNVKGKFNAFYSYFRTYCVARLCRLWKLLFWMFARGETVHAYCTPGYHTSSIYYKITHYNFYAEPLLSTGRLTIIPHAYVHEILHTNNRATGVRVTVSGALRVCHYFYIFQNLIRIMLDRIINHQSAHGTNYRGNFSDVIRQRFACECSYCRVQRWSYSDSCTSVALSVQAPSNRQASHSASCFKYVLHVPV